MKPVEFYAEFNVEMYLGPHRFLQREAGHISAVEICSIVS
jgi:hypothetical protein